MPNEKTEIVKEIAAAAAALLFHSMVLCVIFFVFRVESSIRRSIKQNNENTTRRVESAIKYEQTNANA